MKRIRALWRKLIGPSSEPEAPKEDPAAALSDERVLGRSRHR